MALSAVVQAEDTTPLLGHWGKDSLGWGWVQGGTMALVLSFPG
jgi:hypothetical protein